MIDILNSSIYYNAGPNHKHAPGAPGPVVSETEI